MATGFEVTQYLRPEGGFIQRGEDFSGIEFIWAEPFTKEEWENAFALVEAEKAQAEAQAQAKRSAALAKLEALGLDEDDLKALGL